jgi:methionine sulfoxide reductase heme-binding subunit
MRSQSDLVARPAPPGDRHGRTLGAGRDLRRRLLLHHTPIALASTAGLLLLISLAPARGGSQAISRLASPTGDIALVLLGLTLLVGPANLLLGRRNPPNNYLRRDLGIWTAIFSIIHVIVGFQGHGGGAFGFVRYFVADGRLMTDSFGLGNWTGLAATVIVAGLLVISTDRYVRELKAPAWKRLQRLNYTLFVLVVVHAIFYGALRYITRPFTLVLLVTVAVVFTGQSVGIWLWRRRNARTAASRRER